MRNPLRLASATLRFREGLVVRIESRDGSVGWGEASPLPTFFGWADLETLSREASALSVEELVAAAVSEHRAPGVRPSVSFAVSTGIRWLDFVRGDVEVESRTVKTAFLIRNSSGEVDLGEARGYSVVKIKVGGDPGKDADFVARCRGELGTGVEIRVDANRRWTYAEACRFAEQISEYSVSFLEEPFEDWRRFREFEQDTGLAVAVDESLQESDQEVAEVLASSCKYMVIKPTMIGGLERCRHLHDIARANGASSVFSSAYETGIGMAGIAMCMDQVHGDVLSPGLGTYLSIQKDLLDERLDLSGPSFDLKDALPPHAVTVASLTKVGQ